MKGGMALWLAVPSARPHGRGHRIHAGRAGDSLVSSPADDSTGLCDE